MLLKQHRNLPTRSARQKGNQVLRRLLATETTAIRSSTLPSKRGVAERRLRTLSGIVALFWAGLWALGCGHPATAEECEEIVERIASLELKERYGAIPAAELKQEIQFAKDAVTESTMKDCVGKRISSSVMRCVREASTSSEIVEGCFD